jgi:hypothetical protein
MATRAIDAAAPPARWPAPVIGAYADVREAIVTGMERTWLQGAASEAALRGAEEQANRAIEEYNRRVRP